MLRRDLGRHQLLDRAAGGALSGDDEHAGAAGREVRAQVGHRAFQLAPVGRRGLDADAVDIRVFAGQLGERPPRALRLLRVRRDLGQIAVRRRAEIDRGLPACRGRRPGRFEELLPGADEVGRAGADLLRIGQQHVTAAGHRIGEQGQFALAEHRDERLHALDRDAAGQLGEHFGQVRVGLVRGGELRRALLDVRREQQFAARRRGDPLDLAGQRTLVGHRERADLADLVAPELDADRMLRSGPEQVEDAAADRELAALLDHVHARVRQLDQPFEQVLEALLLADDQVDRRERAEPGGHRLDEAAHGRDHDPQVLVPGVQAVQHFQPPPDGVRARRKALVRQRLPGREVGHAIGAEQRAERRGQLVGLASGGGDGQHRTARAAALGVFGQRGGHELPYGDSALQFEQRGVARSTTPRSAGSGRMAWRSPDSTASVTVPAYVAAPTGFRSPAITSANRGSCRSTAPGSSEPTRSSTCSAPASAYRRTVAATSSIGPVTVA